MSAIFSLVNFEFPTCYCTAWNSTFSHACEGCHQSGVVCWCAFETVGCYWYLISYGREGINNKHLQEVKKNVYSVDAVDKRTVSRWAYG